MLVRSNNPETHRVANSTIGMSATRVGERHMQKAIANLPRPGILIGASIIHLSIDKAAVRIERQFSSTTLPNSDNLMAEFCVAMTAGRQQQAQRD